MRTLAAFSPNAPRGADFSTPPDTAPVAFLQFWPSQKKRTRRSTHGTTGNARNGAEADLNGVPARCDRPDHTMARSALIANPMPALEKQPDWLRRFQFHNTTDHRPCVVVEVDDQTAAISGQVRVAVPSRASVHGAEHTTDTLTVQRSAFRLCWAIVRMGNSTRVSGPSSGAWVQSHLCAYLHS